MKHKSFRPVTSVSIVAGFTDEGLNVEIGDAYFPVLRFFLTLYSGGTTMKLSLPMIFLQHKDPGIINMIKTLTSSLSSLCFPDWTQEKKCYGPNNNQMLSVSKSKDEKFLQLNPFPSSFYRYKTKVPLNFYCICNDFNKQSMLTCLNIKVDYLFLSMCSEIQVFIFMVFNRSNSRRRMRKLTSPLLNIHHLQGLCYEFYLCCLIYIFKYSYVIINNILTFNNSYIHNQQKN